jgi:hypothetical protein
MRDDELMRAQIETDWDAAAWSLAEVFNAFLLREFEVLDRRSREIVIALNQDAAYEKAGGVLAWVQKALRELIKREKMTVDMEMKLHPAVWLRLLHFVGERAGLRFQIMEASYRKWRKSHRKSQLVVKRQNPDTGKWRSYAMDLFLLQGIEELNLKVSYKWRLRRVAKPTLATAAKVKQAKPLKRVRKASLDDRIAKIGTEVCRNVAAMLAISKEQNLSPMRATIRAKAPKGEHREYQYQGAALKLARHLKSLSNSPVSTRSDEVVAKAVRLYVKCS